MRECGSDNSSELLLPWGTEAGTAAGTGSITTNKNIFYRYNLYDAT
jgi:hypothetical protein